MRKPVSLFVFTLGLSAASAELNRTIDAIAARKLVEEALVALGECPSSSISDWQYYWAPEFYTFQAWCGNTESTPIVPYYLAVNPWNGEVWDAMACTRITSPAIENEQKAIWKKSRLPSGAREPLHDKSPASCAIILQQRHEKKRTSRPLH